MFGLFLQGFLFQLQGVLCHGVNYEIGKKSRRKAPKYAVFRTIKGLC